MAIKKLNHELLKELLDNCSDTQGLFSSREWIPNIQKRNYWLGSRVCKNKIFKSKNALKNAFLFAIIDALDA